MANHFSALKRARQTNVRTERNRAAKTRLRGVIREFRRAVAAKDLDRARTLLSGTISLVDKSEKKGIIKGNTADRFKSRLMRRLHQAAARTSA